MLALAALLLQLLFFLLMLWLGAATTSVAIRVEAWHLLGGAIIWFILVLQFRQRRLADEERRDAEQYERLQREGKDTSVFETRTVESSMHLSERRLVWLEKYLLAIFGVISAAYLIGVGYWQYRVLTTAEPLGLAEHGTLLASAAYLAGFALVSFLFSRYAVGMSQQAEWRPLRAGGSFLLSNALACFALAIVILFANNGYPGAEKAAAYVLSVLMVAIGAEAVLNLVLDAYRPRIKGQYRRAAYESRILGLFSEPGSLLRTAAHAIDYQFGFKVSDTWFYKLLERAILPLMAAMVVVLLLSTSLAIVPTGNVAVLERWGEPQNIDKPLESGWLLKYPWPIDKLRLFPVEQLQTLEIGYRPFEDKQERKPILWTTEHWAEEFPFMVAVQASRGVQGNDAVGNNAGGVDGGTKLGTVGSDGTVDASDTMNATDAADEASGANAAAMEALAASGVSQGDASSAEQVDEDEVRVTDFDLLIIAMAVHYRIDDVAQYGYGRDYCYDDARSLLEGLCARAVVQYAANSDINELMGPGRQASTQEMRAAIEAKAKAYKMGVRIVSVDIEAIHPPVEVAESFEQVVAAFQQKQARVWLARGEASERLAFAKADAANVLAGAQAQALERRLMAEATAGRFKKQCYAYEKGGDVYLLREYLSVLDEYMPAMRKYVLTSDKVGKWVYEIDLKEKLQPDLFDSLGVSEQEN